MQSWKAKLLFVGIFFQPQNRPASLGGLLQPWRSRKTLVKTIWVFGFQKQEILNYHWVCTTQTWGSFFFSHLHRSTTVRYPAKEVF